MPRNKYKPYVRRANGKEHTSSWRVAFRLAFYQESGRPYYVMVQRGWPNMAIEVGASKREVQQKPLLVAFGRISFRIWAKTIRKESMSQKKPIDIADLCFKPNALKV